jgi:spermidine synthase
LLYNAPRAASITADSDEAKTKRCGITMPIDGAIQSTEMDEFSYHEMLSHIVLYSHPNPKRVLIIGGGDMGVTREVLKHKCLELVDNCDIDEKVTELAKKYLPHLTDIPTKDPRYHIMLKMVLNLWNQRLIIMILLSLIQLILLDLLQQYSIKIIIQKFSKL